MREGILRRAQAALETIIIFSISTLIVLILLTGGLNTQATTNDALRISQARSTVSTIASSAEEVYSQGIGARVKVIITVPSEINETESGILNNKTISYRVLTRTGFTDVSDLTSVNLTGVLPLIAGRYELTLTARDDDVLITTIKTLLVTTNKEFYCELETINYQITLLDEAGQPINDNVTIQLTDAESILRFEENKTVINGQASGSIIIPQVSSFGYWSLTAINEDTITSKRVLVTDCGGGMPFNISITNCTTNATNLNLSQNANLACWVSSANPIDTVLYQIGINRSASPWISNWWNYTFTCTSPGNYTWDNAWANNTLSEIAYTTMNGLPIIINCIIPECNQGYYSWITNDESSFNEGTYTNTTWSSNHVRLNQNNGIYESKIFNAQNTAKWNNLTWNYTLNSSSYGTGEMVLKLTLDETTQPYYDTSGYSNNATCTNCPTTVNGYLGNALLFDGTNDQLIVAHDTSLINNNITISFWINRTSDSFWRTILIKSGQYRLRLGGSNNLIWYINGFGEITSSTTIPLNEWTHVIVTFINNGDGNNIARVYINGELDSQLGPAWGGPGSGNNPLYIGSGGGNSYLNKTILDEIIIYNTTLSESEIQSSSGRINISYRSCNNSLCNGESWSEDYTNETLIINKLSQYFQYRVKFHSENLTLSPELYNITINYFDYCEALNIYEPCINNGDCTSGYCRQDFINESNWYCVSDSTSCTEEGINRINGYNSCISTNTELICNNGNWTNESDCLGYQGCDANSTKSTYCGWQEIGGSCIKGIGCQDFIPGTCNDCGPFYTTSITSCNSITGINYCDKGCGATCDNETDYYFDNLGDQCSYGCNNSCNYATIETCGDPGDLYGNTCYYGTNGCNSNGCTTSNEECPTYCINDFNGGPCAKTTRNDPSISDTCYHNRQCLTTGCNLSSAAGLRINYCDYCSISGEVIGDYSPALNATCNSNCPNNGTRYYDNTITRADDCLNGVTQILTENYMMGYTYPSQTSAGTCSNTECALDCGGTGTCVLGTCNCAALTNYTIFYEDFTPSPYYDYNWTRLGTDWDSVSGSDCYGGSGNCAHADGNCNEANDNIQTIGSIIDLSGANNAYLDFYFREDNSFDNGDYLRVWCYTGSTWTSFYQENGGNWNNNGAWINRIATIPINCQISNARFRITIISNNNNEDLHIDEFKVIKEI